MVQPGSRLRVTLPLVAAVHLGSAGPRSVSYCEFAIGLAETSSTEVIHDCAQARTSPD